MSQKETLLYRLIELMLVKQQTFLLLDELYEDEVISPFVRNIQIDSPFQQLIFDGVLSQFSQGGELVVNITVESYYYNLVGKVLQKDQRFLTPESLIQLVNSNNLKGLKAGVSYLLSFDVELGNFNRITEMIDLSEGDETILRFCMMPLMNSLFIHGVEKTIEVILENPTENDWRAFFELDAKLEELQLFILRKDYLSRLMSFNPLNTKYTIWLGLKAIPVLDKELSIYYLNKIDTSSFQNDEDILFQLGRFEEKFGNYDKSINFYQKCLDIVLQNFGEDHPNLHTLYNNIGIVWGNKAKYDYAIDFHQKSLDIRLRKLGQDHPDVATSFNNLGFSWVQKGNYDIALDFYQKCLEISLKTLGKEHFHVATAFINIGLAWYYKGDFNKALEFYMKCLRIDQKTLGEDHPDLAATYNNIGLIWNHKGDYNKALDFYQKCLNIQLKTLVHNHPDVATSYNSIGLAWNNLGDFDKALDFYQKSLEIRLEKLIDHPDLATTYNNIGMTWSYKGDLDKALEFYQKSITIQLKILGDTHTDVATSYNNIGGIWFIKGDFDKALNYIQKCLNIQLKTLGAEHPSMVSFYNNMGDLWNSKGEFEKSLDYYQKCLEIELKTLTEGHPDIANTYNNIGCSLKSLKRIEFAIVNFKKGYEIIKTGGFPFQIAQCYEDLNDKKNALEYYIQSANLRKDHPEVGLESEFTKISVSNAIRLAKELDKENELPEWMKNNN